MRIGIFHDGLQIPPKAGVPYRFYYLSKELASQGIEIVLFLSDRFKIDQEKLKREPFRTHIFSPNVFYNDLDFVESVVAEEGLDVIQTDCSQTVLLYGARYSSNLKIPLVTEMHDVDSTKFKTAGCKDEAVINKLDFVQKAAAHFSDHIICMTPADRKELIELGIKAEKLTLIPNGIDIDHFHYSKPDLSAKEVVFLGNMFYPPNKHTAETIITKIMPRIDARLTLIGLVDDEFREKYSSLKINFVGGVDDIRPHLEHKSLAIAPIFEGSGMRVKFLNFAAAGIPAITTKMGTSGYPSDIAFVEEDINKYPKKINKLLAKPQLLLDQSKKARNIIENKYNWNVLAKNAIDLYQGLSFNKKTTVKPPVEIEVNQTPKYEGPSPLPLWLEEERTQTNNSDQTKYKLLC